MTRKIVACLIVIVALVGGWRWTHRGHGTAADSPQSAVQSSQTARPTPRVDPGPPQVEAAGAPQTQDSAQEGHTDSDAAPSMRAVAPSPMPSWITHAPSVAPASPLSTPVVPRGVPRGAQQWSAPDLSNPDAVAGAFLQRYHSRDVVTDASAWTGPARAASFATAAYAQALRTATTTSGDDVWAVLQEHRGYTTVTVAPATVADVPADTSASAYRAYTVTITSHDDGSWTTTDQATQIVKLVRGGSGWAVANTQIMQ